MAKKNRTDTKQLMDILIYVFFASVLIPLIAVQVGIMQAHDNLSDYEAIIGVITVFIILGLVYGIVKTVL